MNRPLLEEFLHDGQVLRLTLDAPKGNVMDAAMMTALHAALDAHGREPGLKLVQITGAGEHFSFGASVPEHTAERAPQMLALFHGLFRRLVELALPTAALISGRCLGGGLELALMCNVMFVDQSARLGQPEVNLGVFAPPASVILPLKIGQARADELLLSGRTITGTEAAALGLAVACAVDRAAMLTQAEEWTREHILPKSAVALRFAARAARSAFNTTLLAHLTALERLYLDGLMATHDANEGIRAFMERRAPAWTNH